VASSAYSRYVLGVLFLVYVFNFIDRQILSILIDPIKEELGVSDSAMGFLTGFAFAIFYAVAGIPIARLADRGVRRSIIAVGLTVWSVMTALCGLAGNFLQLAAARIGVGVGEAACSPPAHSLISDYFPPERRATAISIYNSGIAIGVLVGYVAGGWIAQYFGWRAAFFVVGLPGVLVALLVRFTIREPRRGQMDGPGVDTGTDTLGDVARFLLARKSFVCFAIAGGMSSFSAYGFGTWLPPFLGRVHGMQSGEIGSWLGLISGIGGFIGMILGGWVTDRLARYDKRWYMWVPAISLALYYPFVLLFLLLDNVRIGMLLYLPGIIFASFYLGPVIAITHAMVKVRMRAVASAILLFSLNLIGMGLGPQVVGVMTDLLTPAYGVEAIRYSLLFTASSKMVSIALFLLAARWLLQDLKAKDEPAAA